MLTLRSPASLGGFGLSRPNIADMAAIEASKPIRWIDSDIGMIEEAVFDLVTQQPYQTMWGVPANSSSANFPANPNVLDFFSPSYAGLMDACPMPTSFRSLTFMALFDAKGTMASTYGLFQFWNQSTTGTFTGPYVNFLNAGPGLFFYYNTADDPAWGAWTPAADDVKLVAGTFDNGSKAHKFYMDDMSAPVASTGSRTGGLNTIVPDGHRLFVGTPVNVLNPLKMGLKSFLLWDRALTAAELTAVGAAVNALAGL